MQPKHHRRLSRGIKCYVCHAGTGYQCCKSVTYTLYALFQSLLVPGPLTSLILSSLPALSLSLSNRLNVPVLWRASAYGSHEQYCVRCQCSSTGSSFNIKLYLIRALNLVSVGIVRESSFFCMCICKVSPKCKSVGVLCYPFNRIFMNMETIR